MFVLRVIQNQGKSGYSAEAVPWAHKDCSEWYKRSEGHETTNHCDEYDAHQLRKTQAREHKENDKKRAKEGESYKAVTFDLEHVLTTPWSNVSSLFYSRKLSTYSLTVYDDGQQRCPLLHVA